MYLMELKSNGGWIWLSVSVVLVSVAQLLLKYAMQRVPDGPGIEAYLQIIEPDNIIAVALPIVVGLGCYVLSVLCWIGTLTRLPLSMAYPSLALSYLLVYFGATMLPIFNEQGSAIRVLGIGAVIVGVWMVSLPEKDPSS